jgi:DNA-binding CsgD family transcriptional regulator
MILLREGDMKFLGTEMFMVTFWITAFELVMLFFQVIYFLQRTSDQKRLLYLVLLVFLIIYNACSGFFPDKRIPIPVSIQIIIAFLVGFTMSMYFVYYFYKAFDLKHLKFFATYGSLLFLLIPFLFLFVVPYLLTSDVALGRRLTVIIPFFYGLAFIYAVSKAFYLKFKDAHRLQQHDQYEHSKELIVSAYIALLCWATLPVIVFFGDFQVLEHSVTNAGFLAMTIIYVRKSIIQARVEYDQLKRSGQTVQQIVEGNCERFGLTRREVEIVFQVMKGSPYKIIAVDLGISEKTVARHVSNIFVKCAVSNKVELIKHLGEPQ